MSGIGTKGSGISGEGIGKGKRKLEDEHERGLGSKEKRDKVEDDKGGDQSPVVNGIGNKEPPKSLGQVESGLGTGEENGGDDAVAVISIPISDSEMTEEVEDEDELSDIVDVEEVTCQEHQGLWRENQLLKQELRTERKKSRKKIKDLEQRIQDLLRNTHVKLHQICPPAAEVDNKIVVEGQVLPVLCTRGYLKLGSLLKCRQVCKQWSKAVTSFLEDPPVNQVFSKEYSQVETRRRDYKCLPDISGTEIQALWKKYRFHSIESLEKFLNSNTGFEGNPFLGKTATFEPWEENLLVSGNDPKEEVIKYWELVSKLLDTYGDHLWSVTFTQSELGLTPEKLYKVLEMCLPHLKNLKWLIISGKLKKQSKGTNRALENSLPLMADLRSLDFGFSTGWIQNAIIANSPSLTTLGTRVILEESRKSIGKRPLRELTLVTRPSDYLSFNRIPVDLKKLDFDFSNDHHYEDNLTELGLSQILSAFRRFPALCDSELKGIISLDFDEPILQICSLENLRLRWVYKDNKEMKGIVEELFHPGGFYRKIASHFPNLRFLNIADKRLVNSGLRFVEDKTSAEIAYNSDVWKELKKLEAVSVYSIYSYPRKISLQNKSGPRGTSTKELCWTREKYREFQSARAVMDG